MIQLAPGGASIHVDVLDEPTALRGFRVGKYDLVIESNHQGGYVYRGSRLPELVGRYFYSDFCSGWLRSVRIVNGVATSPRDWSITSVGNVTSFGEDASGELYVTSANGSVYRIVRR